MKRNLFYLLSLAVAGGALIGCDTDETSCTVTTAATDCGGYACIVADGETEGVCATTPEEGCAAGFVPGTDPLTGTPACVEGVAQTCADLDCGAFLCDESVAACFTECTDGSTCIEGAQCDEGTCVEVAAPPYMYVAVVSRAEGDTALNNPNPGPDLDAISISAGGVETFASVVESFAQGAAGDEENTRPLSTHAEAVTAKDTVDAGGTCDLDAQPGYVAIGGLGGFIVVSFDREIVTTDTISVYEVDSNYCSDAATERPDAYEVYITTDAAQATNPGSADAIRSNWCLVGAQGGNGGVFTQAFNSDNCPM